MVSKSFEFFVGLEEVLSPREGIMDSVEGMEVGEGMEAVEGDGHRYLQMASLSYQIESLSTISIAISNILMGT